MNTTNEKKQYEPPKLQMIGNVQDLTRQNNNNDFSDVPKGSPVQVGYSPTAG